MREGQTSLNARTRARSVHSDNITAQTTQSQSHSLKTTSSHKTASTLVRILSVQPSTTRDYKLTQTRPTTRRSSEKQRQQTTHSFVALALLARTLALAACTTLLLALVTLLALAVAPSVLLLVLAASCALVRLARLPLLALAALDVLLCTLTRPSLAAPVPAAPALLLLRPALSCLALSPLALLSLDALPLRLLSSLVLLALLSHSALSRLLLLVLRSLALHQPHLVCLVDLLALVLPAPRFFDFVAGVVLGMFTCPCCLSCSVTSSSLSDFLLLPEPVRL